MHSADMQANDSRALGRPVRRAPVTTKHPLIRTNPVTGWNALFFNPGFVTKIVGIPKAESDAIIKYLTDVVATTQEIHARFQWGKDDVAIWDNRTSVCMLHIQLGDLTLTPIIDTYCIVRFLASSTTCYPCSLPSRTTSPGGIRQVTGGGALRFIWPAGRRQGRITAVQLQRLISGMNIWHGSGETGDRLFVSTS